MPYAVKLGDHQVPFVQHFCTYLLSDDGNVTVLMIYIVVSHIIS